MYVYFEPQGGINDILAGINRALLYCNIYKRILLVNGNKSVYNINFFQYFKCPQHYIIFDTEKIKYICSNKKLKIFPKELNGKMNDILNGKIDFLYTKCRGLYSYNGKKLFLPNKKISEDIIIHGKCGGGNGYNFFKELKFQPNIKDVCKERYNRLTKPYLCIQIRNTDYKCDYCSYFKKYEKKIRSFKEIYISTDDKKAIDFYRDNGLDVKNFTTFPDDTVYNNLHESNIDSNVKFIDLLCDIYIISMSEKLLSNSNGGFIQLVRNIKNHKKNFKKQFF